MILRPDIVGIYVQCKACGRQKQPVGRDASAVVTMCDEGCTGYMEAPKPGQLWPGESEKQFGYPVGNDGITERRR